MTKKELDRNNIISKLLSIHWSSFRLDVSIYVQSYW